MWVVLGVLGMLCAVLVVAAVIDLKARRRGRRIHIAEPYDHDYQPRPYRQADVQAGVFNTGGSDAF